MNKIEQRAKAILDSINTPSTLGDYGYDSDSAIYFEEEVKDLIIAALTPPEGYVLVPVVPTQEMLDAGWEKEELTADVPTIWHVMLGASPEVTP